MRPQSIVTFERVVLLSILLGIVTVALYWEALLQPLRPQGLGAGFFIGAQIVGIAIVLLLVWLIARRRSGIARWIYILLSAVGIGMFAYGLASGESAPAVRLVLELLQCALGIYAIWLLFRPDAKSWFERRTA